MHVILTHPKYVKAIKGKRTNKRDAKWIANLFRFDIVKASFIPPADIRALRELSRYRLKLSYMCTAEKNRYQNSMTISRIRIDCVLADPFGLSATRIMDYLLSREPFDEENYSLYNTYFSDRTGQKIDYATRYNLPQIIYGRTGYLLPRTVYEEEKARRWLERFDLLASPLASIALPTIDLMDIHARRTHIPAPTVETEDGIPNPQELMKRIQELEAERKSLRQAAHDAASEAKQLREKLSTMEATAGRDRQELADLRELAFSISSEEQETESNCTMDFPQHTTRNILVFGGHPSWYC